MTGVKKVESQEELLKALNLREETFVKEQGVSKEDEYDEYDKTAVHFLAVDGNGNALGTARWRITDNGIKLERFAVKKDLRGKGIGSMLLECVLEDIVQSGIKEGKTIYLHAQISALPLYKKFGFEKEGHSFVECGIRHYRMTLRM